ncbi:hypothetical protein ACPYO6_04440 [Georgenia sp. Z1344]|uniref:hypothetical protein n=1 Tax=Georgenia sp. Z1344 TaxID=3416706 RepID=UPI003CF268BF
MSTDLPPGPEDAPARPPGSRAVRATLLVMAGAIGALGVLGLGLAAMAGDVLSPWPGLTMMLIGQAAALPALVLAALGHRRALVGDDPGAARLRKVLRVTPPVLVLALGIAFALWFWREPELWLPTLGCALVAAQVGLLARLLSR